MSTAAADPAQPIGGRRRKALARRAGPAYLFLLPGFAVFTVVMLYPTVQAFIVSLQQWSPVAGIHSPFVGLANYVQAIHDPIVWRALANSGVYMLVTVIGQMVLGLICAMALDSSFKGRTAFRLMIYVPVITSWVVVSVLFNYLFQGDTGLVNSTLGLVGVSPIGWTSARWPAMVVICSLGVWKGVGWSMLIFLAALQAVPAELNEAAEVDGAGVLARVWHITLPAIRRTIFFISTMLVIGGFNVFISVALITNGGPANLTQVPLLYLWQQAFKFLDFGYGSAIAFMLTAIVFIVSVAQFTLGERDTEGAVA